jgi:hypothetical protein
MRRSGSLVVVISHVFYGRQSRSQICSRAGVARSRVGHLDTGEAAAEFSKAKTEFSIHCLAKARCSD